MLMEFKCPSCGHEYEGEVNNTDDMFSLNICPECEYYFVPHRVKGKKKFWSFADRFIKALVRVR